MASMVGSPPNTTPPEPAFDSASSSFDLRASISECFASTRPCKCATSGGSCSGSVFMLKSTYRAATSGASTGGASVVCVTGAASGVAVSCAARRASATTSSAARRAAAAFFFSACALCVASSAFFFASSSFFFVTRRSSAVRTTPSASSARVQRPSRRSWRTSNWSASRSHRTPSRVASLRSDACFSAARCELTELRRSVRSETRRSDPSKTSSIRSFACSRSCASVCTSRACAAFAASRTSLSPVTCSSVFFSFSSSCITSPLSRELSASIFARVFTSSSCARSRSLCAASHRVFSSLIIPSAFSHCWRIATTCFRFISFVSVCVSWRSFWSLCVVSRSRAYRLSAATVVNGDAGSPSGTPSRQTAATPFSYTRTRFSITFGCGGGPCVIELQLRVSSYQVAKQRSPSTSSPLDDSRMLRISQYWLCSTEPLCHGRARVRRSEASCISAKRTSSSTPSAILWSVAFSPAQTMTRTNARASEYTSTASPLKFMNAITRGSFAGSPSHCRLLFILVSKARAMSAVICCAHSGWPPMRRKPSMDSTCDRSVWPARVFSRMPW